MRNANITYVNRFGKVLSGLGLAALVIVAGCSSPDANFVGHAVGNSADQSAALIHPDTLDSQGLSLASGDALGMVIFTDRRAVLARNTTNVVTQMATTDQVHSY